MKLFITGITGQDGSYLAELGLRLGHEVYGMIRRHSDTQHQQFRIDHLRDSVKTVYGDMTDATSLRQALYDIQPDFIFHLAAQSHVRVSFDTPIYTCDVDAMGSLRLLEAYRVVCPSARYYNAASSEMFGLSVDADWHQREGTTMNPTSPYGVAKVFAYNMTRHYRRAYGLHASNGILYNHEGPRRGMSFVTQKVVRGAVDIKNGLQDKLVLGNLDAYRDWGHAKDYVEAMWAIVNHDVADDYVVATGEAHSVREMCDFVFGCLGMDYRDYVVQDERYFRKEELPYLCGDASKIREVLGWSPKYTFQTLLREMIDHYAKEQ